MEETPKPMLVRDLIAKLQQLDPGLPVMALVPDYDQWHRATGVRQFRLFQVCEDDHPAPFSNGGKPLGDTFDAIVIY